MKQNGLGVRVTPLWVALSLAALLSLTLAACGGSSPPAAGPGSHQSSPVPSSATIMTVKMTEQHGAGGDAYFFTPPSITIKARTTVMWINTTDETHTLVSDTQGVFPGNSTVQENGSFQMTSSTPGTYTYYSRKHPDMKGTITVTA
jgi:plastocyanin